MRQSLGPEAKTLDKIQRLIEEQRKAAHVTTSSSTFAATNGHIDAKAVNHAQQRPLVATAPDTVGHTIISVSGGAALVTYSDSDSPKKDTTPATSFQKSINSKEAPPRKVAPSTSAFKHADRSSKWPKASVTRADPKRWDITWSSHSSAVADDVDSAIADNGQNPNKKATRRASVDSQGYKLVDWTGTWAPAPVDWDARPAFRDKQSAIQIESWMDKIEEDMHNIDWKLPMHDIEVRDTKYYFAPNPKKHDLTLMGEPVPRYWIPTTMGRQAPQTFWSDLVKSEEPQPVDEDDLVDVKPWWEHLPSAQCHFLRPYVQPWIKGIDPDESIEERIARENDNGSSRHAENRRRTERAKQTAKRDSRKRALELAARRTASGSLPIRNPHAPLLNIYIRRATLRDMPEIRDIYNHYVDHGVCTPETSGRTTLDMQERFQVCMTRSVACVPSPNEHAAKSQQDTQTNTLPYLVACERGGTSSKGQRRARKFNADFVLPDRIVGFAHADDYNDMLSMYRFTAEIEVFTHKEFLMKGIAKCLLDKLIGLLDPGYVERGGFEVVGDDLIGIGPSRLIKMIVCNFPYDAKKPEKVEWVGRWLCSPEWLGFKEVGNLEGVGNKEGKVVNLAIFQKTTGATLDPENPPIMMRG